MRRRPLPALLVLDQQPLEGVGEAVAQALALLEHPLVVAALEQVAGVELDRGLEAVLGERPLEVGHVEPVGRVLAPAQAARGHLEVALGVGQRVAQRVQHLAQVRARLRLARVRPQQEREPLPGVRLAAVHEQVGEQRDGAGGLERHRRPFAAAQLRCPEKTDVERRRGGGLARRTGARPLAFHPP